MTQVPLEVSNFFLAMQAGQTSVDAIAACFAEDAVYEEPFTGTSRTHHGRDAVMKAMALGWEMPMVDTRIRIDSASTSNGEIHIEWTCFSPSLPGGKGHGLNRFSLKDGQIVKLITTLREEDRK
ncbi:MAG: nuclear transport factor 2 family protein [Alphaproteobacteria bacterium]|nr:nuclear transport factor 2 family protein [Alphaproteobacteria bacterium]